MYQGFSLVSSNGLSVIKSHQISTNITKFTAYLLHSYCNFSNKETECSSSIERVLSSK